MTIDKINITLLEGNFEDADNVDAFAPFLADRVSLRYPSAHVRVNVQRNTSGYSPRPSVTGDDDEECWDAEEALRDELGGAAWDAYCAQA